MTSFSAAAVAEELLNLIISLLIMAISVLSFTFFNFDRAKVTFINSIPRRSRGKRQDKTQLGANASESDKYWVTEKK